MDGPFDGPALLMGPFDGPLIGPRPETVRAHRVEERRDKAERKQYDRAKRLIKAKEKRALQA